MCCWGVGRGGLLCLVGVKHARCGTKRHGGEITVAESIQKTVGGSPSRRRGRLLWLLKYPAHVQDLRATTHAFSGGFQWTAKRRFFHFKKNVVMTPHPKTHNVRRSQSRVLLNSSASPWRGYVCVSWKCTSLPPVLVCCRPLAELHRQRLTGDADQGSGCTRPVPCTAERRLLALDMLCLA